MDKPAFIRFSEDGGKTQSAPDIFLRFPNGVIRGCTWPEWIAQAELWPDGIETIWSPIGGSGEHLEACRSYDRALRKP